MSQESRPVGIVVNPRAGTDVRRAVAAAASVTVEAKANAVRRVVLGAHDGGATRFVVHRDPHGIVRRATETIRGVQLEWVDQAMTFTEEDTVSAVEAMRRAGCAVVVVLGGDGTNRAAARAWRDVPVIPVSTGTNNAFAVFVEATVAGSAAGRLATGRCGMGGVSTPAKLVSIRIRESNGGPTTEDLALVDAVVVDDPFLGSYELFDPATLHTAVLTRADPTLVGFAGVGGLLEPVGPAEEDGLLIRFGRPDECRLGVRGPTAPGHFDDMGVREVRRLRPGEEVSVAGPLLLALDGERKLRLGDGATAAMSVRRDGPRVVDVAAVMAATG